MCGGGAFRSRVALKLIEFFDPLPLRQAQRANVEHRVVDTVSLGHALEYLLLVGTHIWATRELVECAQVEDDGVCEISDGVFANETLKPGHAESHFSQMQRGN